MGVAQKVDFMGGSGCFWIDPIQFVDEIIIMISCLLGSVSWDTVFAGVWLND